MTDDDPDISLKTFDGCTPPKEYEQAKAAFAIVYSLAMLFIVIMIAFIIGMVL